jgi:hypothetical protein
VVLKGTGVICGLRGTENGIRNRMMDQNQTAGFARFCADTHMAPLGDPGISKAIEQHREAARLRIEEVSNAAPMISESRKMLGGAYSKNEIRLLRTGQPSTHELLSKFVAHVCLLAAMLFRDHPLVRKVPSFDLARNRFLFRLALCVHIWTIEWIAAGSAPKVSTATIRNDIIDLHFVTYATYFDGLMSDDQRSLRIYEIARRLTRAIQAE